MRIFCKSSFIFFVGAASMRSVLARENVHFKKKTKQNHEEFENSHARLCEGDGARRRRRRRRRNPQACAN
jgi:hypothetical protein